MTNPFNWQGPPLSKRITKPTQTPLFNGLRSPTNHKGGIVITDMHQGAADAAKRQAIKRGAAI